VTIGGSIALIIIGAILKFAVNWTPGGVDLQIVGVILMCGGVVGLIISIGFLLARRRRVASAQVYEERRYTEPPSRYTEPPSPSWEQGTQGATRPAPPPPSWDQGPPGAGGPGAGGPGPY
jgi:hypothetical protein